VDIAAPCLQHLLQGSTNSFEPLFPSAKKEKLADKLIPAKDKTPHDESYSSPW
jgi:hypothetical protein